MRRNRGRSGKGTASPRCRSDRGAVLVETAFTLPFLLALIFGIIDFGFAFNDWISVRQGGRDGLRQAIVDTSPTPPDGVAWSCPTTGGPAAGTDAYAMMCFTKARVGLDQNSTRVKFKFNSFAAGQPVKICVQYKTYSLTGAFATVLNNKVLDTEVESLIEQPSSTMTSFAETPVLTGGSWPASCDQL